jgi:organic hydroperoxide reductase OsmC/OhrA
MHTYTATLEWARGEQPFTDNRYSRRHTLSFDGGAVVPGSSSTLVVRAPFSDPSAVDPEEMFVASLSSCHMLWFLSIAAGRGFRVDRYADAAVGVMDKDDRGKVVMTVVTLRPRVDWSGERQPSREDEQHMHHEAHEACFIANSVRTAVRVEPVRE